MRRDPPIPSTVWNCWVACCAAGFSPPRPGSILLGIRVPIPWRQMPKLFPASHPAERSDARCPLEGHS
eukprot:106786-Pyramimonas_sp.AAC.1